MTKNPCIECPSGGRCRKECYMKKEYRIIRRKEEYASAVAERRRKEKFKG